MRFRIEDLEDRIVLDGAGLSGLDETPDMTGPSAVEGAALQPLEIALSATDPEGAPVTFHTGTISTDQANDTVPGSYYSMFTEGWQSFTAGKDGFLTTVQLKQAEATDRILTIHEGAGITGKVIYQQTFTSTPGVDAWLDFKLNSAIKIQDGNMYTVRLESTDAGPLGLSMDLTGDNYSDGEMGLSNQYDYLFRTVVADTSQPGLPGWLNLTDLGDNTATLNGTPDQAGSSEVIVFASDGVTADMHPIQIQIIDQPTTVNTVARLDTTPTNANSLAFEVTFSKAVTGVGTDDFALASTDSATAAISSVTGEGETYTVTVNNILGQGTLQLNVLDNDSIIDASGMPLGGSGLGNGDYVGGELYSIDRISPTAAIQDSATYGEPGGTAPDSLSIDFSEDVTGVDLSDFVLYRNGQPVSLQGGTLESLTPASYILDLSGVVFEDGAYSLQLPAAGSGITDLVGNPLDGSAEAGWALDLTAPTLNWNTIASGNTAAGTLAITASEPITGLDLSDVVLTHDGQVVDLSSLTLKAESNTSYSIELTDVTTQDGTYTLSLPHLDSAIQDGAGNFYADTLTQSFTLDMTAPSAALNNDLLLHFSEPVQGLDLSDFTLLQNGTPIELSGASLSALSTSDYQMDLSGMTLADGDYQLILNTGDITDEAGNGLAGSTSTSWSQDLTAPSLNWSAVASGNQPAGVLNITTSEPVQGLDLSDLALTRNGATVDLSGLSLTAESATSYTVDLSSVTAEDGTYALTLQGQESGIQDGAGNLYTEDLSQSFSLDMTAPTASLNSDLQLHFSEPVQGLDLSDLTLLHNGVPASLGGAVLQALSDTDYQVDLSAMTLADGDYELQLNATESGIADTAGNNLASNTATAWTQDLTAPVVESVVRDAQEVQNDSASYTVNFSEAVSGVDTGDFLLTTTDTMTGAIATVEQTGETTYRITINNIEGVGTLRLDVTDDGTIADAAGNALGGEDLGDGDYTSAEAYTLEPDDDGDGGDTGDDPTDPDCHWKIRWLLRKIMRHVRHFLRHRRGLLWGLHHAFQCSVHPEYAKPEKAAKKVQRNAFGKAAKAFKGRR